MTRYCVLCNRASTTSLCPACFEWLQCRVRADAQAMSLPTVDLGSLQNHQRDLELLAACGVEV